MSVSFANNWAAVKFSALSSSTLKLSLTASGLVFGAGGWLAFVITPSSSSVSSSTRKKLLLKGMGSITKLIGLSALYVSEIILGSSKPPSSSTVDWVPDWGPAAGSMSFTGTFNSCTKSFAFTLVPSGNSKTTGSPSLAAKSKFKSVTSPLPCALITRCVPAEAKVKLSKE